MQDRAMRHGYAFISADYVLMAPATGHDVLEDIKDLFQYLHKVVNRDLITSGSNVTIDATSLIVSGSSAGGLCAYLAALHASPKPKGVLSLYGQGGDFLVILDLPTTLPISISYVLSAHIVTTIPNNQDRTILPRTRDSRS